MGDAFSVPFILSWLPLLLPYPELDIEQDEIRKP